MHCDRYELSYTIPSVLKHAKDEINNVHQINKNE